MTQARMIFTAEYFTLKYHSCSDGSGVTNCFCHGRVTTRISVNHEVDVVLFSRLVWVLNTDVMTHDQHVTLVRTLRTLFCKQNLALQKPTTFFAINHCEVKLTERQSFGQIVR